MKNPAVVFDQDRAAAYDEQFAKLAPMRDSLHLFIRMILADLPSNARVLCVGAGTGAELLALAEAFPHWQFTAVEPAEPMLAVCRQKAEAAGIAARCTFHQGYLDTLPETEPFDAATCLLVSHFFMEKTERCGFFRKIAERLRPEGYLVSSDLTSDMASSEYKSLLDVWLRTLRYTGLPAEAIEKYLAAYGKEAALLPREEVASIIASGGFDKPVLFYQALLIHAWYAKRTV